MHIKKDNASVSVYHMKLRNKYIAGSGNRTRIVSLEG